jgi:hypothetical protein
MRPRSRTLRLEPGRLRRRRARADHRVTRTLTMTLSAIGYRLLAIGYWLWYRASRPPEMRRDVLSQSGGTRRRGVQGERQAGSRFALSEPNSTRAAPCGRRTPADAWSGAYARAVICYGSRPLCCSENTARTRLHLANTDHLPPGAMVFEYITRHSLAQAGFTLYSRNRPRIGTDMTDAHGW